MIFSTIHKTEYTKKLLSDATGEQLLVKEKVFAAQGKSAVYGKTFEKSGFKTKKG